MRGDGKGFTGKGFGFPVRTDPVTGRFVMVSEEADIAEAVRIIIMTRKGERVMRPEFGCGIHAYMFAAMDYTNIRQMEHEVRQALLMWEPRITGTEVHICRSEAESDIIEIHISYRVRSTNNPYNLVYPYYINEGMEAGQRYD